ncbi:MAG TPA: amidohydrolase family protein [Bdellovibrionales bacterium]|nr:amidohydrolase family protein [Bdellovibrionales bacterium]
MRIDACFDSHVHWAANGEFVQRLALGGLTSAASLSSVTDEPSHRHGDWILGFGWDDEAWTDAPSLKIIDAWESSKPAALSRRDGHAYWGNSAALRLAGIDRNSEDPGGGRIGRDGEGRLTGVLIDRAMDLVRKHIPRSTAFDLRRHLLRGMQSFNRAGYTHVRDMTCDIEQWNEAVKLEQSGLLTLAVEEYFWLQEPARTDGVLVDLEKARATRAKQLRVMGAKIFLDGALGSGGAKLSRCYHGEAHSGLLLWEMQALKDALRVFWEKGFAVAVHAIGDRAAEMIVDAALEVGATGRTGALHIEHGELIRPETILKMKALEVEVHLQPAHWLSDRKWLGEKTGDLSQFAFPWRRLQEAGIPFDFGSDAPIEPASLPRMFEALRESAKTGVPRLLGDPATYMRHRDLAWVPNCFTQIENDRPAQVVFRGEHLL